MSNYINFLIDINILKIPNENSIPDNDFQYCTNLNKLYNLINYDISKIIDFFYNEEILSSSWYKNYLNLIDVYLKQYPIKKYASKDISRIFFSLFNKINILKKSYLSNYLNSKEDHVINKFILNLNNNLHQLSYKNLLYICLARLYGDFPLQNFFLFSPDFPDTSSLDMSKYISIFKDSLQNFSNKKLKKFKNYEIFICNTIEGLFKLTDCEFILQKAINDRHVELAIKIAIYRFNLSYNIIFDPENIQTPSIGPKFRLACQKICSDAKKNIPNIILTVIAKIQNEINLRKVHPLRESQTGNSDPVKIDGKIVQRAKINRDLRLHYIEGDNRKIKLLDVTHHKISKSYSTSQ
jgi:hypothetical protein